MPYFDIPNYEGQAITRVTEVLRPEFVIWMDKYHPKGYNRAKRIDFSGIRGTSVHQKIEDYICETEGIPVRPVRDRDILELQIILEDLRKPYLEQVLIPQIKRSWVNFLKYWKSAKEIWHLEVLYVEVRTFSPTYMAAGTVDLLITIKVKNRRYLSILDWKSGKSFSDEYSYQMSAYREFIKENERLGKIQLPKLPWWDKNFSVLLGGIAPEEHQTIDNFKNWLHFYKRSKKPQKRCNTHKCVFCPDIIRCPDCSADKKARYMKRLGYTPRLGTFK